MPKNLREYLTESSLSRLWRQMQEHDAGTITAYRSKEYDDQGNVAKEYTRAENKARNNVLGAKLRMKYGVTRVKGAYIENYGTPKAEEVGESTFFVVDISDRGTLEKDLRKLGQEFNQDSVMFIPKGTNRGILWGTKRDEFSNRFATPKFGKKDVLPKAVWGLGGEFMTKVRGRPFLFTEEMVRIPKIEGYSDGIGVYSLSKKDWGSVI